MGMLGTLVPHCDYGQSQTQSLNPPPGLGIYVMGNSV